MKKGKKSASAEQAKERTAAQLEKLRGLTLVSCEFSTDSYTFNFFGRTIDGVDLRLKLSTSDCVAMVGDPQRDVEKNFSAEFWNALSRRVVNVSFNDQKDEEQVKFELEDGIAFVIWPLEELSDNLIIIQNLDTNEWTTIL